MFMSSRIGAGMTKRISLVEFRIPGYDQDSHEFRSSQSLLDADIVVFRPDISSYLSYVESYRGFPSLSEDSSFRLKNASNHWRKDLLTFVNEGKTAFILLSEYQQVYAKTGEKTYSGTGRNTRTTNIVALFDNFQCLPLDLPSVVAKTGTTILFKGNATFSSLWKAFEDFFEYECYFEKPIGEVLFTTKTGSKTVGALIRSDAGGAIVLLPNIIYDEEAFTTKNKKGEDLWTKDALAFGNRLIQHLVDIDNALRSEVQKSPPPDWTSADEFKLRVEVDLTHRIEQLNAEIDGLRGKKERLESELSDVGILRALVFEKGKPLEAAVIRALRILGFTAESYEDDGLQLDQVIVSPEGDRYIGESEGRDGAAINIEKFRQLATNIQEDLERDDVLSAAKGILFGNAFRLLPLQQRPEYFTAKCTNNAVRSGTVLIPTPELFRVAKAVSETGDMEFARRCRQAISSNTGGLIKFPSAT
jgi:hypothetical protein